jgi:hypothetical protein
VSSTTPTIWNCGRAVPGASSIWKEARSGSRPDRYFRTNDRLTITTGVEDDVSRASKSRPETSGVRRTLK